MTQVRLTVKQGLFLSELIFSADSLTVFVQLTGAVSSINICTSIMAAIRLFGRTRIMHPLVGMVSAVLCFLVEKTNKPKGVFFKTKKVHTDKSADIKSNHEGHFTITTLCKAVQLKYSKEAITINKESIRFS